MADLGSFCSSNSTYIVDFGTLILEALRIGDKSNRPNTVMSPKDIDVLVYINDGLMAIQIVIFLTKANVETTRTQLASLVEELDSHQIMEKNLESLSQQKERDQIDEKPNSLIWNILSRGYAWSIDFKLQYVFPYRRMSDDGHAAPDKHTLLFVLKSSALLFAVLKGQQIHAHQVSTLDGSSAEMWKLLDSKLVESWTSGGGILPRLATWQKLEDITLKIVSILENQEQVWKLLTVNLHLFPVLGSLGL
ncbi:hypothetical protein NE237_006552 [Protea cynaroides]|uniref:Uncharacterized protein n=1 Tax=Protea cynaroides TaxID=273540 RepID=A0A9Q0QVF4_9MAGN|nr:hypothetical protein NE237_006552 [Protea cynaroides]